MNSKQTNEWIKRALIDVADAEFAPYAAADHDAYFGTTIHNLLYLFCNLCDCRFVKSCVLITCKRLTT